MRGGGGNKPCIWLAENPRNREKCRAGGEEAADLVPLQLLFSAVLS